MTNLEDLRLVIESFTSTRLADASRAVLARAFSKIGNLQNAEQLLLENENSTDPCSLAWETMFRIEALRHIDQSRARKADEDINSILNQADPETKRAIEELRETYLQRGDDDNPAAFLARENRSRTYPRGPRTEAGEMYRLSKDLEEKVTAGNEPSSVAIMRQMMTIDDKTEYDNYVKLPQFIETLVAGLEKFKWGDRGSTLVPLFEDFCDRAPGYLKSNGSEFYRSILHSNLAHGLLIVESMDKAITQLQTAANLICDNEISDLDFIDAAAALVRTVEQLPLNHRSSMLKQITLKFGEKFDQSKSPYLLNERLFAVLARSLDQISEAASSKDQISLQQFRNYQLQDEFIILQRIQEESFITTIDTP